MMLDSAARITGVIMALAFAQQSLEHLHPAARGEERLLFAPRLALSLALLIALLFAPVYAGLLLLALVVNHLAILPFFNGPYNGGADRMGLLILLMLTLTFNLASPHWREVAFGYLGLQLVLSYCMAGWVKVVNPAWRNGQALRDVFLFSAYPAGENLRRWADHPRLLWIMGWAVMGLELGFPLTFFWRPALVAGLMLTALFHGANACLFGLNRFFWIWLCAYPSLLWLQERVMG